MKTAADNGDLTHFSLGKINAYFVNHPDDIRHILQENHRNYSKNTIQYNALAQITGRGLLTNDGDDWLRNRRLAQPAFTHPRMMDLDRVTVPAAQRMLERWEGLAASGTEVDLDREMMALTLEVVGLALFNIDLSKDASELTGAVITCLDYIVYQARYMVTPPLWVPTPRNLKFKNGLRILDAAVADIINQRKQAEDPGDDLLGMLLRARDEQTGAGLSIAQVRDEVITLLIAGHETVASALTWAWRLLTQHPQIRQAMLAELKQALGDRLPTSVDLQNLPLIKAVFSESLRLYPPAWLITRRAEGADELRQGKILPGSLIIISPYVIHRRPDFWDAPEEFKPQRFMDASDSKQHRYAFIPFGGGPRLCIGNQFAQVEASLILACVLQRFLPEVSHADLVSVDPLVTLRPRGGMPARLIKI
ncbi:MAG: cytochrome P450 [Anaerolineaceae bacterium]|nr:cytochrome P450 [Anaerolineaceae bacterium]